MADYDVIICGAGSGGGFLAGEIAPFASVLILDAGPHVKGAPNPGFGSPDRRKFATQINMGTYGPDGVNAINRGGAFFAYPLYTDDSNPASFAVLREARVVGGGSFVNVGAWLRPLAVDFVDFAKETGVVGWTKADFEPHFQKAERILFVHRDHRDQWQRASVLYEKTALALGIPVFETASNRHRCIFCGHRVDAGMPCKYDALMSTAITQIPKALDNGAQLVDNATVVRVEISNSKATGVTYIKDGQTVTANARKLVVVSAGAIGTPLVLRNSGVHLLNNNVGKFLRAHPGITMDAFIPGVQWNSDRGYQWNCHHYVMDDAGKPMDALVHASTAFPVTPWLAANVGTFGKPYKDLMRLYPFRIGVFVFHLKPGFTGKVLGSVEAPFVRYPILTANGEVDPKMLRELSASIRQVGRIFQEMGAIAVLPGPNVADQLLINDLALRLPIAGVFHDQGTCRAGADRKTSVVDSNCMSHDIANLMCCDASVIPKDISCNSNSMVMAVASKCSNFVITQILGRQLKEEEEPANV